MRPLSGEFESQPAFNRIHLITNALKTSYYTSLQDSMSIICLTCALTFDLLISPPQAGQRDAFVQERYGRYDLSDPFMALQRDSEAMQGNEPGQTQARGHGSRGQVNPSPLAVLKLVMSHCKRMQEKMMAQLAAAENRHRRVRDCVCVCVSEQVQCSLLIFSFTGKHIRCASCS